VAAAIDPDQPLPIYVHLKTLLLEEILGGRYGHGGRCPRSTNSARSTASAGPRFTGRWPNWLRMAPYSGGTFVNPHWVQHNFVFVWNDLLLTLTLLDRDHQPITVGLANLQARHLAQENLVSAGAIMAILPPLLLFALLNRYYVRGLFAGGVKG
jgi:hypothetical protein